MDMFVYFRKKYPDLFRDDYFISFGCGDGWKGIVEEVCKKIVGRGAKIIQLKEKFGGLRIYLDYAINYRVNLTKDGVVALKDGKIVEKEIPGSEPMIDFNDYAIKCDDEVENFYLPGSDKFFNKDMKEIEIEDRDFIKGRLAQLTGLVDAEPIEEEKINDIINWAEDESFKTCENCGAKDNITVEGGWIKALCKICREDPERLRKKIKIEMADSDLVDGELRPYVDQILEAVGHPEALVTDESTLFDFICDFAQISEIGKKLGVDVINGDYLFQIAERLKKKGESGGISAVREPVL